MSNVFETGFEYVSIDLDKAFESRLNDIPDFNKCPEVTVSLVHNNEVISGPQTLYYTENVELNGITITGYFYPEYSGQLANSAILLILEGGLEVFYPRELGIGGDFYDLLIKDKIPEHTDLNPIEAEGYSFRFTYGESTKPEIKEPITDINKLLYLVECKEAGVEPEDNLEYYPDIKESMAKIAFGREALEGIPLHQYPSIAQSIFKYFTDPNDEPPSEDPNHYNTA